MLLYHGSNEIVERPRFGLGKATNDYGRGFYCTEHVELAREWACPKMADGFVNSYELDASGLAVLDLNAEGLTVLHWLCLLVANRPVRLDSPVEAAGANWIRAHFSIDTEPYDIIRGYRADDSYFPFVRAFFANGISLKQLTRAMRLGNLGEQIMVKSERAFDSLSFGGYEVVPWTVYNAQRRKRDEEARAEFRREAENPVANGLFMIDILREGLEPDDARLR